MPRPASTGDRAFNGRPHSTGNGPVSPAACHDHLIGVRFVSPSTLELQFPDQCFSLPLELLQMPVDEIRWGAAAVTPAGDALTLTTTAGETIPIKAATLRYLVDKDFAVEAERKDAAVRLSRAELAEMARENPPPPELFRKPIAIESKPHK